MNGVAKFQLIGTVARIESENIRNGSLRAKVLLVVDTFANVNGELQQKSTWYRLVYWRDAAKMATQKLRKGVRVFIEGDIEAYSYPHKGEDVWSYRFVPRSTKPILSVLETDALRVGLAQTKERGRSKSEEPASTQPPEQGPPAPEGPLEPPPGDMSLEPLPEEPGADEPEQEGPLP